MADLKGKKVLEIGAGTGRDSFPLTLYGAEVYQVDYSYNSLHILKKLAESERIETNIVGGDTFVLPFHDDSFDFVFHQGLLEHFRKDEAHRLLKENIRVLKRGGMLLVDVPQRYHVYTVAKHFLIAIDRWFAGWERSFSILELQNVLKSEGLQIIHSYGEWMYPSFLYRVFREVCKKTGVLIPLYPQPIKALTKLRKNFRQFLNSTPLPLISGISIGVIGRKN